jgi:hypothetical protein
MSTRPSLSPTEGCFSKGRDFAMSFGRRDHGEETRLRRLAAAVTCRDKRLRGCLDAEGG